MYQDIQPDICSYDYQVTTPEYIKPYDNYYLSKKEDSNILNILKASAQNKYPYLGWAVDLENSYNQPGCFSTCQGLADPSKPSSVYDYNSCMDSCSVSGTSSGVQLGKRPGNRR